MKEKETQNVGRKCQVFSDPITQEQLEGTAVILKSHDTRDYYQVKFLSDGFVADRFIKFDKRDTYEV